MHLSPNEDKVLYQQFELLEESLIRLFPPAKDKDLLEMEKYYLGVALKACKGIRSVIYDDLPEVVNSSSDVGKNSTDI